MKFNFLFQIPSYETKNYQNTQTPKMLMKKHIYHQYTMDKPWKFKSNTVLFLIRRVVLTIQSNICNKSVSKIVNGVWPDYNVRDQNNGA